MAYLAQLVGLVEELVEAVTVIPHVRLSSLPPSPRLFSSDRLVKSLVKSR